MESPGPPASGNGWMCGRYLGCRGVRSAFLTQDGLPSPGRISPGTAWEQTLTRAALSSDEPLHQAHRKLASSVSTPEPVVTHWAPDFLHGVGGERVTLQPSLTAHTLRDLLCCSPPEDGSAPGMGHSPLSRGWSGPPAGSSESSHLVLPSRPLPWRSPHSGGAAPRPLFPRSHTAGSPSSPPEAVAIWAISYWTLLPAQHPSPSPGSATPGHHTEDDPGGLHRWPPLLSPRSLY